MAGIFRITQTGVVTGITGPTALQCNPIDSIQGVPVASTLPTTGQVLKYAGGQWAPGEGGGAFPVIYTYNSSYFVPSAGASIVLMMYGGLRYAYMPSGTEGMRITIADGGGNAGLGVNYRIRIYNSSYSLIETVMTDYGSLTLVWSSSFFRWVVE
jgi:hypothetical protein